MTQAAPLDRDNAAALTRDITGPAFYLLRPDGHVAVAGRQLDTPAVERYLRQLGIRARTPGM